MITLSELTPAQQTARDIWTSGDYPEVATPHQRLRAALVARAGDPARAPRARRRLRHRQRGHPGRGHRRRRHGARHHARPARARRDKAAAAGVEIDWVEGDAEALPFPDASFDVVTSAVGVMFCPNHERAAAELVRVTRPGGSIGLISWTPAA